MNLPMTEVVLSTPYFVLMDGSCRIGPNVLPLHSGIECSPIYGFSNKVSYDKFCLRSQQTLTPYPLVKGFLRNQLDVQNNGLKLVVVDADEVREPCLRGATMQAVLEAHEEGTSHVATGYKLMFVQVANAYRVEESS